MRRFAVPAALALLAGAGVPAAGQTPAAQRILVRAGRLIDGVGSDVRTDQGILIEVDRIIEIGGWTGLAAKASGAQQIDLSGMTVLAGLIDAHTHILLQGDITAAEYDEQLLKQSIPFRTIAATAAARIALLNGFTTLRDLETEGAMYADVDVKTAIAPASFRAPASLSRPAPSLRPGCIPSPVIPGSCGFPKASRSSTAPTRFGARFASR